MKKYFLCSDVHSFYSPMIEALTKAGYDKDNPDHVFVHCGDLLDRGSESMKTLNFVNSIPSNRKILIRGNHEDLLEECIERQEFLYHDVHNGTLTTIYNLCGRNELDFWYKNDYKDVFNIVKKYKPLYKYLNSLHDYVELGNYIFVHGWIPSRKYSPNRDWHEGDWKQARWFNGMEKWRQGAKEEGKTVVCGHWHTSWGNSKLHQEGSEWGKDASFKPFIDDGIIALDGCVAESHKVNVVVLEDLE